MKKFLLLFTLFLLWVVNCTKPTGPVSPYGPILYVLTSKSFLYIDTATDSIVDSIPGFPGHYSLGVSPDGSKLYFTGSVWDTRKKSFIPGALTGVPSPDGKYLFYGSLAIPSFRVVDARTNRIIYSTNKFGMLLHGTGQQFDERRGLVYGRIQDSTHSIPTRIGVFDYRRMQLVKVINPVEIGGFDIGVDDIVVTHDGRKLYYTSALQSPVFTGIDLVREEVVILAGINSLSHLAILPDDRYIYITDNPGKAIFQPPTGQILVYSPPDEKLADSINVLSIGNENLCDTTIFGGATDHVAVTPDGQKAYVNIWWGDDCIIIVIDTQTNTIKKVINTGKLIEWIGIQSKL